MAMLKNLRRIRRDLLILAILALAGLLEFAFAFRITQRSVDLSTGRKRDRQMIAGICLHENVRDTAFSAQLQGAHHGIPDAVDLPADWRVFSETGAFQHFSPHFTHHSTPTLLHESVIVGDQLRATPEERRRIGLLMLERLRKDDRTGARKLLDRWQEGVTAEEQRR
jgi:hypothetical protein